MRPVKFSEANGSLSRPDGTTKDDCGLLPVFRDGETVISCWSLTDEDLKQIFETKRIWLRVWGTTHAPVCVQVVKPFEERTDDDT